MAKRRVEEDRRLLCEGCGYDLTGLAGEGDGGRACPECGRGINESKPVHRTGTAWQRIGGVRGWWGSLVELVRGNQQMWEEARVGWRTDRHLALFNAVAAGGLVVAGLVTNGIFGTSFREVAEVTVVVLILFWWVLVHLITTSLVLIMIWIEHVGIRFFGKRRGWRISEGVAWTVVGHASYGWLVSGVLCGVLMLEPVRMNMPWRDMELPFLAGHIDGYLITLIGAALWGMIVFEICVYLGVRKMRYANPPTITQ